MSTPFQGEADDALARTVDDSMMKLDNEGGACAVSAVGVTRYVLCGLSARAVTHFVLPLTGKGTDAFSNDFSASSHLSAVIDIDPARVQDFNRKTGLNLKCYAPDAMEQMIREEKPDVVIVAGPDFTHCDYIIQALEAGCDVIAEKPMVLTTDEARRVIAAEQRTGRQVRVTFNVRYQPIQRTAKRLLQQGVIGRVVNIEFTYNLGTEHGASYFFRWNRVRAKSGGLNIHKCCHHLDLLNWLLEDWPDTLFAFGARNYYGPTGAHRPKGDDGRPLNPAETKERCPYFQKHFSEANRPEAPRIKAAWDRFELPYQAQYPLSQSAYLYDDEIDIEDTYGVLIRYRGGAIVNYSINFSSAWEGFTIGINGTHGRIQYARRSNSGAANAVRKDEICVMPLFEPSYSVEVERSDGGHNGADEPLQRDLFAGVSPESEALQLTAGSIAGAYAVAAGEAIYTAITTGQPVKIPSF